MKKFGTTIAAILAACAMLNLTGCAERQLSGGAGDQVSGTSDSKTSSDGKSSEPEDPSKQESSSDTVNTSGGAVIEKSYDPISLSDNNVLNSIRLYDAIVKNSEQSNTMFSPLSLNMALGLLEAGAEGATKAALDSYLQTENFSDFAEAYMKLAKERYSFNFKSEFGELNNALELANSLWAKHSLTLKTEYKQRMSDKFDAEIQSVDFKDKEKTLGRINGWVSDKTHGMIKSVLNDFPDNTAAVLINTLYFESPWREKWFFNEDYKQAFTLLDGTVKEVPLMENGTNDYFENDNATAFGCCYMNGIKFIGILPKKSGDFTLEGLDIPSLLESETRDYDVTAVMPRLTFDTEFDLKDALSAAGLQNIFTDGEADFSGMTSQTDLFISDIFQKTRIELDENGTKAAAATVAIANDTALPIEREKKDVRLDRPFAFLIYDEDREQILFMGKVTSVEDNT